MNTTLHTQDIRLRMQTNEKHNDIHPAIPGCRPRTYPKNDEEEEEEVRTPTQVNIVLTSSHRKPAPTTIGVVSVSHEDSTIP